MSRKVYIVIGVGQFGQLDDVEMDKPIILDTYMTKQNAKNQARIEQKNYKETFVVESELHG
jgi:hypothetical protein